MNSIFDALITKKIARGSGGSFVPTESQLNAMNSGITASDVQQIDENKTNISSVQTSLEVSSSDNEKVLTASYSGGVGSYSWVAPSSGGNCNVIVKTTDQWNADPTIVSTINTIYVYSDFDTKDGVNIPAAKIGDGLAYVIDLPFINSSGVTPEDIERWNNKVSAYIDAYNNEILVLSTD